MGQSSEIMPTTLEKGVACKVAQGHICLVATSQRQRRDTAAAAFRRVSSPNCLAIKAASCLIINSLSNRMREGRGRESNREACSDRAFGEDSLESSLDNTARDELIGLGFAIHCHR